MTFGWLTLLGLLPLVGALVLALPVRGAARYFGSEQTAAERLVDAVGTAGVECQVGIADQLPTAVFAARAGRILAPGEDAEFLAELSIRQLATEPSLSGEGREEPVEATPQSCGLAQAKEPLQRHR